MRKANDMSAARGFTTPVMTKQRNLYSGPACERCIRGHKGYGARVGPGVCRWTGKPPAHARLRARCSNVCRDSFVLADRRGDHAKTSSPKIQGRRVSKSIAQGRRTVGLKHLRRTSIADHAVRRAEWYSRMTDQRSTARQCR